MSQSREEKAKVFDENRFKIAQQNAVVPGGPMNNSPLNVESVGAQPASLSGVSMHPYEDSGGDYPQMGATVLNPYNVPHSQVPNQTPVGQRLNSQVPYNLQQQPSPAGEEPMEGLRLGTNSVNLGLNTSQFMGPTGSAALMPGALDPTIPGSGASLTMMPPIQAVDGGQMVPGSTPQKIQKKGKK